MEFDFFVVLGTRELLRGHTEELREDWGREVKKHSMTLIISTLPTMMILIIIMQDIEVKRYRCKSKVKKHK